MHLDKGAESGNWIKATVRMRDKTGKVGCAPSSMLYPGTVAPFPGRDREDDTGGG